MSQVLTLNDPVLQNRILTKLRGYGKPVKTKHLAKRLNIERADLVASLNQLRSKGAIAYIKTVNDLQDSRGREDISFGWVLVDKRSKVYR